MLLQRLGQAHGLLLAHPGLLSARSPTATRARPRRFPGTVLPLLALGACGGPYSTLDPASSEAAAVAALWWAMLAGAALLLLLVLALFAWTFRRTASRPLRWVVLGGLVLPVPVLAALLVAAFAQGEFLLRAAPDEAPFRVTVTARQWAWEARYPDTAGLPPSHDVIHVPAGRTIEFAITSEDVIHSFWVPRLGGKIDAVPGRVNHLRLRALEPGRYGGLCAEFCGLQHETMRFEVIAHDPAAFPPEAPP